VLIEKDCKRITKLLHFFFARSEKMMFALYKKDLVFLFTIIKKNTSNKHISKNICTLHINKKIQNKIYINKKKLRTRFDIINKYQNIYDFFIIFEKYISPKIK